MLRLILPLDAPEAALPPPGTPTISLQGRTMGTYWALRLIQPAAPDPVALRAAVVAILDEVIRQMSNWEKDSLLTRYNQAAAGTWHDLPPDMAQVIACALDVAAASGGAYDPTIGPLVDLWGFGPAGPAVVPDEAAITDMRDRCGWQRLLLNRNENRLYQPGGLHLDLSAIAKGFAVDKVAAALAARKIRSFLVDIGGELRGWGIKPDASPWWVGLERARTLDGVAGGVETKVALHGLAIATSGDSRRFISHDGRRLSHTIDPRTGYPIPDRLAAVTVLHPECMLADVWATALGVLGPEAGMELAAREGLAALFLLREGDGIAERFSPALAAMVDDGDA
jgi:thiamine biosynthesis lipoprotein